MFDVQFTFRLNPAAKAKIHEALRRSLDDTLKFDILPEAFDRSPHITGNNARSIKTEVEPAAGDRIEGSIFTESGYGGYLEIGTSKMPARPYLFPAVERHAGKIFERARKLLR